MKWLTAYMAYIVSFLSRGNYRLFEERTISRNLKFPEHPDVDWMLRANVYVKNYRSVARPKSTLILAGKPLNRFEPEFHLPHKLCDDSYLKYKICFC